MIDIEALRHARKRKPAGAFSHTRPRLSTAQLILLGFLALILTGSLLLSLPIAAANGKRVAYVDALFTAATSACVTGLVTLPTATAWSTFGQIVILMLIQIGGLGVITLMAWFMMLTHRRIGISGRLLIQDSFNLDTLSGLLRFVRKVTLGTLAIESVGALLYMAVFIPDFGLRGVWISIFNSVSAFCNAGIDVISANGLCDYALNPLVNGVTCALIVLGGIGYIVWWDVVRVVRRRRQGHGGGLWAGLTLHSKIAISTTLTLLLAGTCGFLIFESGNPETFGNFTPLQRLQAALFQSVTTRTAGFATVPQQNLTNGSAILSLLLMFIGGSPVGTAGGVKTVTAAVALATALSVIHGRHDVNLFHRRISETAIRKAMAVICCSFLTAFISTVLLSAVTDAPALDILYETISATATVGLTRSLTGQLNLWGKLIICATMYFGRVGPISLAIALSGGSRGENTIRNPIEEISIG